MDANTLRRLNYLWKYRHNHDDDTTEAELTEIRVTIKHITDELGTPILTTKGDLHGFDTDQARIPVGADGEVLTADSAEALGVKWDTGGGGAATPTVLIAAVNTVYTGAVNYTCDGTDDDVTIETAMAAVSPGGRVVLTDGTFTLGNTIDFTLSPNRGGITIEGMGPEATIITKANGNNNHLFTSDDNISHNRIANLSIDGNKANCTAGNGINWQGDYLWLDNLYIHDCDGHGVFTPAGTTKHFIKNCYVAANGASGFSLSGAPATLNGCVSTANTSYGYVMDGAGQFVNGCYSSDNAAGGYYLAEIYCHLVGNFSSNDEFGVSTGPGFNTIIGNIVINADTYGIGVGDCSNNVVNDNLVYFAGQHGILLVNADLCLVANNRIINPSRDTNNTYDGIVTTTNCDWNYIIGNHITGNSSTPKPRYGVNINASSNSNNHYLANLTGASGDYGTAQYNDAGTTSVNTWPGAATPQGDNF